MKPEDLLQRLNQKDFAFLIGNGINRYVLGNDVDCSWNGLLKRVANEIGVVHNLPSLDSLNSITYTEYYSMLLLEAKKAGLNEKQVQKCICSIVDGWKKKYTDIELMYKDLLKSLKKTNCPVLTTNIDRFLDSSLQKYKSNYSFRKVFPIGLYYSSCEQHNPNNSFGVWHINGVVDYPESLRFGLIDYSKLIIRCGKILNEKYEENDTSPIESSNQQWEKNTWLGILMGKPLCIVGLGLESEEIFLRSLLLRKVRWNREKDDEPVYEPGKHGWYCYTAKDEMSDSKRELLRHMGIEPVMFEDYDAMYKGLFGIQKAKPETSDEKPLHFSDD